MFSWLLWPRMSLTVTSYNGRYIHHYVHLFTTPITIHTPLVLDCPHSQRTLHTLLRIKLHTLMRRLSVCFPNIHMTRPCDLRRQAHCAARSPVNHWPAPATRRRRRRGSNCRSHCVVCKPNLLQTWWCYGFIYADVSSKLKVLPR